MPGLFSWYNNQYSSWNRMRRIHAPEYVARVDSRTSRNATAMHNGADVVNANANGNDLPAGNTGDVVLNMGDLNLNSPTLSNKENKDTLFGPSIGVVNTAPDWCAVDAALDEKLFKSEKKLSLDEKSYADESDEDELTPEIVKEWVRRSKEPSEPTTTLQALVNLKRPSIRLSPLANPGHDSSPYTPPNESQDSPGKHHQLHGLEFEFDCDAPQCFISLHVFGVPSSLGETDEHNAQFPANDLGKENERLVLFETTLPGGFARKLTLGDGAVLELARLETAAKVHRAQLASAAAAASATANGGNKEGTEGSTATASQNSGNADGHERHRKRLTFFRKRGNAHHRPPNSQTQSGQAQVPAPTVPAGPALAVVDAEAPHVNPNATISPQNQSTLATFFAGGEAERLKRKKEAEEEGVRIAIRLAARDSDGHPMKVRNEQVTYLHIVRQGLHPSSTVAGPSASPGVSGDVATTGDANASGEQSNKEQEAKEEGKEEDDTRPWVVRVVKREARIGAHVFQLHEIYGLTAHATASDTAAHHVTPSSPTSSPEQHTYPPTPGQPQTLLNSGGDADDSPAECLLCLSAAREVVLLPCRHLVACRECAINMVEFGAGGTVVQPEAEVPNTTSGNVPADAGGEGENAGESAQGNGNANNPVPTPAAPTPTPATRRKRKAKGWFCPVCRQPYTSLLRITTTPPPGKGAGLGHSSTDSTHADAKRVSLTSSLDAEADPQQQQETHPLATVLESGVATPVIPQTSAISEATTNTNSGNVSTDGGAESGVSASGNLNANGMESRGGFASLTRPAFLRHLSGRARERDLERGA